jgi:hypothetical protein
MNVAEVERLMRPYALAAVSDENLPTQAFEDDEIVCRHSMPAATTALDNSISLSPQLHTKQDSTGRSP